MGLESVPPTVGTDVHPGAVFVNYSIAGFYTDRGAGGVGFFREDTGWTVYTPAVAFTAFASPANKDDCKDGGWQNLVRLDFTPFSNQGQCVSYVETGK